jgi:DNA-binding transcriptional ArsR family regulator
MADSALSSEDRGLIEDLAAAAVPMGMTPIEARVHALLMISFEALTLDEIVALLDVSKSSVSVATRELERHGAAQRYSERGTKRVRYGISERSTGFLSAQVDYLGAIGNLILERAEKLPGHAASSRLQVMGSLYLRIRDALENVLKS